jgi:transketolase
MRRTCLNMVYELAQRNDRVVFIGSDLSPGLIIDMQTQFPDRYFMEGIAEAHTIGMAAGLAMDGYIPYVNTIATFITRRCYEQVAVDLCMHDLPVRLIANGGGYVYAPLGPTHQATEDIAIMRALPNMAVVCPADADEMTRFMNSSLDWPHPIYIRMAKGGDPIVTAGQTGFEIGKGVLLRDAAGSDSVLLVSTGVTTTRCLAAAEALAARGLAVRVLHLPTVKPLDQDMLTDLAAEAQLLVTVEEHSLIGGLGSAVSDCLIDRLEGRLPKIRKLGIPDIFAKAYGGQDDLMHDVGIQSPHIVEMVEQTLGLN